jgi:KEOPS complex subunit Pcc1
MLLKANAKVVLPFQTKRQLVALMNALKPEVEKQVGNRSVVALTNDGLSLILSVAAEDTIALRSALNAYLRWINSVSMVLSAVSEES